MKEFIDYLERKIEGCDSLGGMEREKAIYQSVLKDYRKQLTIHGVSGRSEQLVCDCGNKLIDKELYFGQCLQCDFEFKHLYIKKDNE